MTISPAHGFVLALVFAVPCLAQTDDSQTRSGNAPLVNSEELRAFYYTPSNVEARYLEDLAKHLYARDLFITDRGGYEAHSIRNLQRLGDTLIIYDTEAYGTMLGKALADLDAAMASESEPKRTMVAEWTPQHIAFDSALAALTSFRREASVSDETGRYTDVPNVSIIRDQGLLVLRDTPSQVQAMQTMLERIDQPEPQLMVSCLVIRGQHHDPGTASGLVPEALTHHLKYLVPYEHFRLVTMGLVRASVRSKDITIEMDGKYELRLETEAYDAAQQALTVQCRFEAEGAQRIGTSTTIHAGEYTVLGGTGAEPLFAVVRIVPIVEDN